MNAFARDNKDTLIDMYVTQKKSCTEMAEIFNTYPNKILRALRALGVTLRDIGESMAVAYENGRKVAPNEGLIMSEERKLKIGASVTKTNEGKDKQEFIDRAKIAWDKRTDAQKESMRAKANVAVRTSAKEGSQAEHRIVEGLKKVGYTVYQHRNVLQNGKLEVDIFLPGISTIIEVDGLSHYEPIWGEDAFKKVQRADGEKNALIVMNGMCIIRVRVDENPSMTKFVQIMESILAELKKIETKFPDKANRLIYI